MFRHERPQKGRYRQFHQVGVEALGYAGPDIDAEHILMCERLWRTLALNGITLELNSLGSTDARTRYRQRLVSFLEQHRDALDEDSRRRLQVNPLRILDSKHPQMQQLLCEAPRMSEDLDELSLRHFEELQASLKAAGVSYRVNPRLVRGLDYYNATVFEWVADPLGAQGTVCAGGRYDGLVEQIGGKPTPACGFAMGVERLLSLLHDGAGGSQARMPDAYLVHHGALAERFARSVAERLRDADLAVLLHCGGGSFKSQMRRADASGARFAVIVGEDEARAGAVSVKPLRTPGEQVRASIAQAVEILRKGVTDRA
jgi:histidyl-tRNA synthetase